MQRKMNWNKILFRAGVIAHLLGAVDPLEGSVIILSGAFLVFITSWLQHDRFRKFFLISFILISAGVFLIFLFSWLGGFGGDDSILPWALTLTILPYPAGWLLNLVVLIIRAVKLKKNKS